MPRVLAALEINMAVQGERKRERENYCLNFSQIICYFQATTICYRVQCHLILYDLEKIISVTGCAYYLHL